MTRPQSEKNLPQPCFDQNLISILKNVEQSVWLTTELHLQAIAIWHFLIIKVTFKPFLNADIYRNIYSAFSLNFFFATTALEIK